MKKKISIIILTLILAFSLSGSLVAFAADTTDYYVCFSNQNYAIRNANKMTAVGDEYVLEDVSLSSLIGFYIDDDNGTKYYATNGEDMSVSETASLNYTIKFSPTKTYTEAGDWEATGAHITYSFYIPASYEVTVGGGSEQLTYNSYHTEYDLYYISSIQISGGETVEYGGEIHEISSNGYYRILFTPGETVGSNTYLFDENGSYGSGDRYIYHIYIEDAPRYFMTIRSGQNVVAPTVSDATIDGEAGYLLTRYESNLTTNEYRSAGIFIGERDLTFKYYIYEEDLSGGYRPINDDNDEDTAFSSIDISDVGWYNLSFVDGAIYLTTVAEREVGFGGYYLVGEFNNYNFSAAGELEIDNDYELLEVEIEDEDYNEDYIQYKLELVVAETDLVDGELEFYISDGETKYKNGTSYIRLTQAGRYKILFSNEHIYGRGLNYRYTLIDESIEREEIKIGTVEEFKAFATSSSISADYSRNKSVYLTADLDFSGVEFTQIKFFAGLFFGGYHSLSNITLSGDENEQGIFGTVTIDATLERLNIRNIRIDTKADYVGVVVRNYGTINELSVDGEVKGDGYVGMVAYNGRALISGGTTVDSNTVYQRAVIKNSTNNAKIIGELNVGSIAGFNSGEILSCTNNGEISGIVNTKNGSSLCVGGLAGYSAGKISDCQNSGKVDAKSTSLYVGGLVGILTSEIYLSKNTANVFGGQYVGGNIGYYGTVTENQNDLNDYFGGINFQDFLDRYFPDNGTQVEEAESTVHIINYLINTGNVEALSYAGGVLGNSTVQNLPLKNCISVGDIEITAGSFIGGIAGYMTGGEITSCMSAGEIKASGLNGGQYVGGIAGYADTVRYSSSSASLIGSNYIGGIAGLINNALTASYTNVVIVYDKASTFVGSIAGFATNYDQPNDDFNELISYNYYVGTVGGIGLRSYGQAYDYAASSIASDALASKGMLSESLHLGFDDTYWQGGNSDKSYPVLKNLESLETCDEYDNAALFESLFNKYVAELSELAERYSRVTYTVSFMEWNEDNGDLLDGDKVDYDSFELIYSVRLYDGEKLTAAPEFLYAVSDGARWIYEGDDAHYFVSFSLPDSVSANTIIYAEYSEISLSITDSENRVLVEGKFDMGTSVEIVSVGESMRLKFMLNGEEITVGKVTVKYFVAGVDKTVTIVLGSEEREIEATLSGDYITFELEDGQYFKLADKAALNLPGWAWALIGGGSVIVLAGIAFGIFMIVKRRKSK